MIICESTREQQVHIRISYELSDPEWDNFLTLTPGGQYVQCSLWAQVKALNGWRVARITIAQQGRIVAGAQLLMRPLPLLGSIGYLPRGPLLTRDDPELEELVIHTLFDCARTNRCQAVIVQPPSSGEKLAEKLPCWGLRQSSKTVAPTHTLLLDLTQDIDELLAQMKAKTRYNVRIGPRKGVILREGTAEDLPDYYRLLVMTSERQNFAISSEEYYRAMLRIFEPQGHFKLFIAEYNGQVISAQLAIPFGDTVMNKMTVWSGLHGNLKPNEALLWKAIQWSKAHGYHYYDFGGLNAAGAKAVLQGEPLPEKMKDSVTSFKIGFGGQIVASPGAYVYFSNPILRWADHVGVATLENSPAAKKFMHYLRTR